MSARANPKVIGGFVIGAIFLIVSSLLIFSSGSLLRNKSESVTFFPGTVQGLSIGAPVMFRGVQVGQVTSISLDYWPDDDKFLIPVRYEIWTDQLKIRGSGKKDRSVIQENFQDLIREAGLRARLEVSSFVTGQYFIALDLLPDTEAVFVGSTETDKEIPAVTSTRDELAKILKEIDIKNLAEGATDALQAITDLAQNDALMSLLKNANVAVLDFDRLIAFANEEIGPLSEKLEVTLDAYNKLAKTTEKEVSSLSKTGSQALEDISGFATISTGAIRNLAVDLEATSSSIRKAAEEIEQGSARTFKDIDEIIGEDSASRYNLGELVEEMTGAARSLRLLADYIENKPESLIFGK